MCRRYQPGNFSLVVSPETVLLELATEGIKFLGGYGTLKLGGQVKRLGRYANINLILVATGEGYA